MACEMERLCLRQGRRVTGSGVTYPIWGGPPAAEVAAFAGDRARLSGRHVLSSIPGLGGVGDVWKARDRERGRFAAITFIRTGDLGQNRRFLREAKIAARRRHPNIAQWYEIGVHEAKLDPRQKLKAIRDAAVAPEYAHRDSKPGNIMVEDSKRLTEMGRAEIEQGSPRACGAPWDIQRILYQLPGSWTCVRTIEHGREIRTRSLQHRPACCGGTGAAQDAGVSRKAVVCER